MCTEALTGFVKEFPILCNMMEADCKGSKKKVKCGLTLVNSKEKKVLILLTLKMFFNFFTFLIQ